MPAQEKVLIQKKVKPKRLIKRLSVTVSKSLNREQIIFNNGNIGSLFYNTVNGKL
jgi:effector-binding domain-containing protein